jgi:hypothetical protein
MKLLQLIILLLLLTPVLNAQVLTQVVRGVVTDQSSSIPIAGANVIIKGTNPMLGSVTDNDGKFKIESVPTGRYDIEASFIGYETIILREVVVSSSKQVILTILMEESAQSLKEVVIKATYRKQESKNTMAPVSSRMISVEEAGRYAGSFNDPARLAASMAGVAGSNTNNAIVIRGNSPRYLLWRIEGVETSNPSHFANTTTFGGGGITALSSQMLSNSDFFTGAFPAEYGNALSGVLDIKMRSGNNEKREHAVQIGTLGLDASSEGPFKKGKNATYLFNYRFSTMALVAPLIPESAAGIRYQDMSFKCTLPTKKWGKFTFWGLGSNDILVSSAKKDSARWVYNQDKEDSNYLSGMAVVGAGHFINIDSLSYLRTNISGYADLVKLKSGLYDNNMLKYDSENVKSLNGKISLSIEYIRKFNSHFTNNTGVILNNKFYDYIMQYALTPGEALENVVNQKGDALHVQAYNQSKLHYGKLTMHFGIHSQYFSINKKASFEPRIGLQYKISPVQTFSLGYGKHTVIEMLQFYFIRGANGTLPNRNLDFSKANHFVLGYDIMTSEDSRIKIEPYYQKLYNIPVIPNSSFSVINMDKNWFISDSLINNGKGENYGIDITVERFLHKGFYYMITGSLFSSGYTGGDGITRSSRFNKGYLINVLGGKEWKIGKNGNNLLGINGRLNFQGGDHYTPVNSSASILARKVVLNDLEAFTLQLQPVYYIDLTISYTINKKKHTSLWSLQLINVLQSKEFWGYRYNLKLNEVDKEISALFMPNLSYKVMF